MEGVKYDGQDIEQMWGEALVEFHKLSGHDPKKFSELSIGDVIGKINQQKELDDRKAAKYGKAKEVLNKTLTCIQTLGSLVAQGASMVFGPSDLCFNAVSYLITVAQNYSKIFSGIAELFERISHFLERFEVYVRSKSLGVELDIHLSKIIHELLWSFMRICALSIKISRENKLLLALEVFSFGSDKGVQAELDVLEALVKRETGMGVALTLESAKITEGNVTTGFAETKGSLQSLNSKVDGVTGQLSRVSNFLEQREFTERMNETDGASTRNSEKIKHELKIEKEVWRNDQEEFMRTRVPSTGQWLLNDSQFIAWIGGKSDKGPILALEAKQGYGKSFLCSMVIRHLFHLHPPAHQDSRTSIAYYFFQKENKDEKSVNKALRAIVWQLTDNDVVYRKWVAAACNKPGEFGNSLELWKQLVFQFSTKTEATFFIVLDGIDEAEMSTGHPLIEIIRDISLIFREKRPLSIRLLLTGRPRAFMEIRNDPKIALSSITLGIRNEDDIVKYIDARMDHMEILKRSSHPDIQELRSCIRVKLTGGVGGDFFKLNFMLTEISKKRRRKEIEEVLEHADEDRLDTIAREIDRLNKTLGEEDIQELSDLLGFVITSIKAPTLELLEAVLLVKNGEGSLVPLREQIQDKYSAFLEIASDGTVSITSDAIIDFFRNETFAAKDLTPGRRGAALHEAEVAIIRRFLRNVCDEELFNKFGFEEFFKRKLSNKSACINVNFDRAKVDIVAYCLDAICGEPSDQTACLVNYASYFLVYHLDDVDLDLIAPEPKSYIGSRLIKLFSDEECINAWWAPERMWMYEMWTYEDANVMTIMKWFKDSAVVKGLSGAEKEWLNGLTSNSKPDDDLLRPTAKIMAKRWLRYLNWGLAKSVLWLLGYVNKIKSRIDGSERTALTPYPTEEQILELESWAESELNVTEKDKYWKLQMAFTFVDFRLGKKAVELSLSSCEDEPDNWEPQFCLARAYGQIGEHKKALQVLSSVIEAFREDQTLLEDRRDFFCTEVLHSQGLWSCCINEYDASMAAFAEISNHQPDNYWSVCSMIDTMYKEEKYSDIMALLKNMQHQTNSEGLSRLVALVHEFAYDHVYHLNVIDAGKHSNQWGVLKEIYRISIDAARNHPNKKILTFIRRWYGIALYKFPESEDDRKEAISVWEENVGLASTSKEDFLGPLESPTIDYLASIYLEKAKHEAFDGPLAEHYVAQLLRLCELLPEKSHANFGRLILARLYFLMGKRDNALDAVKWFVKFGLDLLSDEDLANDSDGYYILATSLHFVDDINSLAAWSLLCPLVEETENQGQQTAIRGQADEIPEQDAADEINPHSGPEEHTPLDVRSGMADNNIISAGEEEGCEETDTREPHYLGEEPGIFSDAENNNQLSASDEDARSRVPSPSPSFESRVGTLYIRCDGNRYCDRTWTFANDIYVCKDCLKVHLCKYCFDKLQAGTLRDICSRRSVVCEKSHEFLHVPRWNDEEASRIPNGHVKVGENVITITDWVNNMRSQYGLTVGERSDAQIGMAVE
ncbi:hypothetical protein I7I53_09874 [Histoplasma capsulatum var. duboisii H88]|uniref:Fungal STAND N-terminal Goodbye domain-containing protein n=1 Tax=Ajellomyces capsulatus (strain H88) TaxID=544711 RepID=A0A8A1LBV1_AJEC8|nr:hypothetical protein I7I53_09874 [Histoplasma capsulatum var. duboisii H88]